MGATKTSLKTILAGSAAASIALLSACGEAPDENGSKSSGNTYGDSEASFKACMVTDSGGIDDRSFNESGWNGFKEAVDNNDDIVATYRQSDSSADFEPNLRGATNDECDIVIGVGGLMTDQVTEVAEANPDQRYGIVDAHVDADNVFSMEFNAAQSSFLAGYAAAGTSETETVATWGGVKIPPVTIFMDGFVEGVEQYNADNDADVDVLGWDPEDQEGSFTGDFEDTGAGKSLTENFIAQGADVIHPVAGPVGLGGAAAIQESDGVTMVWVDSDGYESLPEENQEYLLTSSMKNIAPAVEVAIQNAYDEGDMGGRYVGTLENEGVSLAPFHDFDDDVSDELKEEIEALKQQIIDGDITVESPAAPAEG
ncbi:BMP family lipoprotein [Haloglycomyces albus]|uniref:BMP family lipoprotein n=1 Tax=Haloglycomyces albus TaxID=526067 RepID=UPI0004A2FC4C|nr:BMP family ABC transporter substrate-binding protein [Haloglycomyces albus]